MNWYVIYTKPKCEKKVAHLLSKRKIENFIPLNGKLINDFRKSKIFYEPLFKSYVFVFIDETMLSAIQHTEGYISLVYWKGKPAIILREEIEAIREFTADHKDITLEKTHVSNDYNRLSDKSSFAMGQKILIIKNRSFSVTIPSLGITMMAKLELESIGGLDISFGNKELLLQSQS